MSHLDLTFNSGIAFDPGKQWMVLHKTYDFSRVITSKIEMASTAAGNPALRNVFNHFGMISISWKELR